MSANKPKISDKAVKSATGRAWDDWFLFLDKHKANKLSHSEIVRLLHDKGGNKSGWWTQTIAIEYERSRGLRIIGQTSTAGFEIGVQKTFSITPFEAWELLTKSPGIKKWLGEIDVFKAVKGEAYETKEGIRGEIRSIVPLKKIRLTWKPDDWEKPSTLQISIVPRGEKTSIRFHQEKLSDQKEREKMRGHWKKVLEEMYNKTSIKKN